MPFKDIAMRREYNRQYRAKNREKLLASMRQWYADNKEWVREYRKIPEVKERIREREKNRCKIRRSANPEQMREWQKRSSSNYRKRHPERVKLARARYLNSLIGKAKTAEYRQRPSVKQRFKVAAKRYRDRYPLRVKDSRERRNLQVTAAVSVLRALGILNTQIPINSRVRNAALAYVRQAGLLPPKPPAEQ